MVALCHCLVTNLVTNSAMTVLGSTEIAMLLSCAHVRVAETLLYKERVGWGMGDPGWMYGCPKGPSRVQLCYCGDFKFVLMK